MTCHWLQALKILLATVGHFNDFMEDQFDFHAYCVRKMTLRAYVQMLRMEDTIHKNIFYSKVRPRTSLLFMKALSMCLQHYELQGKVGAL